MKSALILFATALAANAQDTRTVVEPTIPARCATLSAQISSPLADETHLDTPRIQQTLDSCAPGKAVVLARDGSKNAFLTGPLDLRRGVTLVVSGGVTLFASNNPAHLRYPARHLRHNHRKRPRLPRLNQRQQRLRRWCHG